MEYFPEIIAFIMGGYAIYLLMKTEEHTSRIKETNDLFYRAAAEEQARKETVLEEQRKVVEKAGKANTKPTCNTTRKQPK